MRKHYVALLAVLMLLMAAIPMQALAAASGITTVYTSSTQTIMQGKTGKITLSIVAEHSIERVAYRFRNSSGVAVGGSNYSDTISATIGATRSDTIDIDTSSMSEGKYVAEYWIEYYDKNNWFSASTVHTFNFKVIGDECYGNHDLIETIHREPTCLQPGIALYSCKNCDYEIYADIPMAHVYNDGECTRQPTVTLVGEWTYTCKVCGNTKIEPIPTSHAISITTQPKDASAFDGAKATVSVKATGKDLKYVWEYSTDDGKNWKETSESTGRAATYSLTMNESRDNRQVRCKITNKYKSVVYSDPAKLDAKFKAAIVTQPKNAKAYKDEKATTTVNASGDGLTYQWYYKNPGSSSFKKSSITTAVCAVTMTSDRDGRQMYCIITDKYGNKVQTKTVTLSIKENVKITSQPKNASAYTDESVKFTVTATGDGLKYQWQYRDDPSGEWKNASSTKSTYSPTMTKARDNRQIRCVVTDEYGMSEESTIVTMTLSQMKITTEPKSCTKAVGKKASFSVKATGDGLKYQWYYSTDGGSTWKEASSSKSTYSPTVKDTHDGRKFYCKITDMYGNTLDSNTVTLTLDSGLKITTQPKSCTKAVGKKASFSVKATGDGLKYQWYYSTDGGRTWKEASSSKSTYSPTVKDTHDGRKFYCLITDMYGNTLKSDKVTLTLE